MAYSQRKTALLYEEERGEKKGVRALMPLAIHFFFFLQFIIARVIGAYPRAFVYFSEHIAFDI